MSHWVPSCAVPVALIMGLGCSDGAAQQGLQRAIPADAVAFVGVDNVAELRAGYGRSPIGQLWDDPALAPLRAEISQHMQELRAMARQELGVDPFELPAMLTGPFAVALLDLPDAESSAAGGNVPTPLAACLLADVGDHRDECRALLATLMQHVAQEAGLLPATERIGSDDVMSFTVPASDTGPSFALCQTFHGNVLVLTARLGGPARPDMQRLLDGLDGRAPQSLASRPAFAASLAGAPDGPNQQRLWVDVPAIVDRLVAHKEATGDVGPEERALMQSLGVRDLGPMSMLNHCSPSGSQLALRLDWSGEGWIQRLAQTLCRPGTFQLLRYVPADCRAMYGLHTDYAGLFDEVVKMLIDSKVVSASEVVADLAQAEDFLGFNPRDDLLDLLDGETVVVTSEVEPEQSFPGLSADPQNYALLLGLKDGAGMDALVGRLVNGSAFRAAIRSTVSHGHTIYNLPLIPSFALNYTILDDVAVVSLSSQLVEEVLARRVAPGEHGAPSLADHPDFTQMDAKLRGGYGVITYQDAAGAMRGLFKTLAKLPEMMTASAQAASDAAAEAEPGEPADDPEDAEDAEDAADQGGDMAVAVSGHSVHASLDLGPFEWLLHLPFPDPAIGDKYFHGAAVSAIHIDAHGVQIESVGP